MNIFYVDECPIKAGKVLADKHIVKMPLESAQMLSTAHHLTSKNKELNTRLYEIAHPNHPSTIWARQSTAHYHWLLDHFVSLCNEFEERFNKEHKCFDLIDILCNLPKGITNNSFSPPPQCMPNEFKGEDTVQAYRNYYHSKTWITEDSWKQNKPNWFTN